MTMDRIWFLPKKPKAKRILFHAINHVGLGHINRSIAVAQWLKAGIPDLQVLFLIEGGEDFIEPTGFPWIFVPGQPTESENCEQITRNVLNVFRPDLAIIETRLREQIHRPIREAGVKEVLMGNVGDLLRSQLRENLEMMNEVNLFLVLQRQQEVQPSDQALIAEYTGKTVYAGPLVRQKNLVSHENLRQKLGLSDEHKVILATFGGGGWDITRILLASLLAAKEQILAQEPNARMVVITGPHFNGDLPAVDDFVCYASRFEPFITDYLDIASTVVCMAGYSTVNEVAASGIPAICVPAPEAEDQVGAGGMGEYALSFPNFVLNNTDKDELARQVIDALAKKRDLSVTNEFWQRAGQASQSIIHEIENLVVNAN
jgi:UDP-N-acetylglucosamine--N-acetylmuramyl-(pentapeptide) pyrophosphoryl-undecaprenol N-acetylglucosamine transferase